MNFFFGFIFESIDLYQTLLSNIVFAEKNYNKIITKNNLFTDSNDIGVYLYMYEYMSNEQSHQLGMSNANLTESVKRMFVNCQMKFCSLLNIEKTNSNIQRSKFKISLDRMS